MGFCIILGAKIENNKIMFISVKKAGVIVFVITVALAFHCFIDCLCNRTAAPDYSISSTLPVAGLFAAPVLLVGGYRIVTDYLVTKYDEKAPRDPSTGILYGAGPMDLSPENSPGAVLLIHGFVGTTNNFNDLPESLADAGWRVRAMLLPGHGTSPLDLLTVTADSLLSAVRQEYDTLKADHKRVVIIGHSMGGTLSALIAAETDPDAIVLCAPYFGVTHKWYYGLTPETWTKLFAPVLRWVPKSDYFKKINFKEVREDIVSYHWIPMKGVSAMMELGNRANQTGLLGEIDCPVLFIHSKGDDAAFWRDSENAFERISSKDKRFVWLERSNHIIFWDYEKDVVTEEILGFLGGLPD